MMMSMHGSKKFCQRGPTLTTFFLQLMRGSKYYDKRAIIDPPAKRHSMAFRWRADNGPTLNVGLVAL